MKKGTYNSAAPTSGPYYLVVGRVVVGTSYSGWSRSGGVRNVGVDPQDRDVVIPWDWSIIIRVVDNSVNSHNSTTACSV